MVHLSASKWFNLNVQTVELIIVNLHISYIDLFNLFPFFRRLKNHMMEQHSVRYSTVHIFTNVTDTGKGVGMRPN